MIYRFFMFLHALLMRGVVRVTFKSGSTVTFRRPKASPIDAYAMDVRNQMVTAGRVLRYDAKGKQVTLRAEDIAGVEIW